MSTISGPPEPFLVPWHPAPLDPGRAPAPPMTVERAVTTAAWTTSRGLAARAAARLAVTGPATQAAGQPSMAATGVTPATALVTKISVAAVSWSRVSGFWPTLMAVPRAARMTADRVVPGSRRPSAGGVSSTPSMTAKTLARSVSSSSPVSSVISSCSSAARPAPSASSASSLLSRHLCAPMPPGTVTGRRVTAAATGGTRGSGTTSILAWRGPPTGRTVIRSRPDGLAASRAGNWVRSDAGRVAGEAARLAVADEQRGEHPRARAGQRFRRRQGRARVKAGTHRGEQRGGLDQAFGVFGRGVRVRDYAAAGAKPGTARGELERPDGHVELQARDRGAVPDRAGIHLAWRRLNLVDDFEGADLGCPGHRAGRERGADQVAVRRAGQEGALDRRDQVPYPWMRLGAEQVGDRDGAWHADPGEVVADQVDDHHVLRPVLRRPLKLGKLRGGPLRVAVPPGGALDRLGDDPARVATQEQLGGERRNRGAGVRGIPHADERTVGRPELGRRPAERVKRVAGETRLGAQADVGLEDVTLADVLHGPADRFSMAGLSWDQPEGPELVARRAGRPGTGQGGGATAQLREAAIKGAGSVIGR